MSKDNSKRKFISWGIVISIIILIVGGGLFTFFAREFHNSLHYEERFITSIYLVDEKAYLTERCQKTNYDAISTSGKLTVVDISDPTVPTELISVDTEYVANDIIVQDSYAYIANGYDGLTIFKINQPFGLEEVIQMKINQAYGPDNAITYERCLHFAWNIDRLPDGDYSQSSSFKKVNPVYASQQGEGVGVAINGSYIYLICDICGLIIFDVSNSSDPKKISSINSLGAVRALTVMGSYIYAVDAEAGLTIIDMSNLSVPMEISSIETSGTAQALTLIGSYAYIANGEAGLVVIDVRNASTPIEVGSIDTSGTAQALSVIGSYAYIADGEAGLVIIDVSNASTPIEVGSIDTSEDFGDISLTDSYVYITAGSAGMFIIDVSDPSFPSIVGQYAPTTTKNEPEMITGYFPNILIGNLIIIAILFAYHKKRSMNHIAI